MTTIKREAMNAALGREVERVVVPAELVGDTGATTGAPQLAAPLALAEEADVRGRVAVGCVAVRLLGGSAMAKQVRGIR